MDREPVKKCLDKSDEMSSIKSIKRNSCCTLDESEAGERLLCVTRRKGGPVIQPGKDQCAGTASSRSECDHIGLIVEIDRTTCLTCDSKVKSESNVTFSSSLFTQAHFCWITGPWEQL